MRAILKTIANNHKILLSCLAGVAIFLASSFLLRLRVYTPYSETVMFLEIIYSFAAFITLASAGLFGLVSVIAIIVGKIRGRAAHKTWTFGLCLLLSFMILTPVALELHWRFPEPLPPGSRVKAFNSAIWRDDSSEEWRNGISVRENMLGDVTQNVLPNKNKQEIERLLGPSLKTGYFSEIDKDLIYYLGPERNALSIDSEWLLIWLDERGRFERFKIVND